MTYTGKDVSVILPYIRPEGAERCLAALREYAPAVEVVAEYDPDRIGVARMIAKLTAKTTRPIVCFLADDTVPHAGFLEEALAAMETLPGGWGVVGLASEVGDKAKAVHWMAHKDVLPLLDGEFHYTGYRHCFGSDEMIDRALEMGRYVKARRARFTHDNPVLTGKDFSHDRLLSDVYGKGGSRWEDQRLFWRRKRARLQRLAIGFPLVDDRVPVQFFTSFVCMEKPEEYVFLLPQFAHGPWAGSIADARNSLVEQALDEGARYLLMLDTDQVYPPETLTRLLSHGKRVCGVRVHSRWEPFAPVFYRGTVGEYQWIPDEEMYGGGLVEVDATGTGCLLIDMEVFDLLAYPWFQFATNDRGGPVGEDIYFCSQVREAGVRIFVDTSIEVGHMATVQINRAWHKAWTSINHQKGKEQ